MESVTYQIYFLPKLPKLISEVERTRRGAEGGRDPSKIPSRE